ncbi:MAG: CDP-diacylglycerol--glycerol-3-phosphate 3-phosphatidyltransferase [Magnetococcales bacterium]|nr:CDP-diacylglycerol--glycerol-3-phosphate 3-phosphatidyltransferase [Magnetococcales bacterium]
MNLPNIMTTSRIVLIPVFVACAILAPGRWGLLLSTAVFGVAALTDWADGYLARTRGEMTPFGRFFDPVADKLLVLSALLLLLAEGHAPLGLVLLITGREIIIMALREYMAGLKSSVPVSLVGKWKTAFQMTAIILLMLRDGLPFLPWSLESLGVGCLYVATFLSLWSGYDYMADAWPRIRAES